MTAQRHRNAIAGTGRRASLSQRPGSRALPDFYQVVQQIHAGAQEWSEYRPRLAQLRESIVGGQELRDPGRDVSWRRASFNEGKIVGIAHFNPSIRY
jgi:hypothetical protein